MMMSSHKPGLPLFSTSLSTGCGALPMEELEPRRVGAGDRRPHPRALPGLPRPSPCSLQRLTLDTLPASGVAAGLLKKTHPLLALRTATPSKTKEPAEWWHNREERRRVPAPDRSRWSATCCQTTPSQTQAREKAPSNTGPPLVSKSLHARAGDRQHTCLQANRAP